MAKKPKPARAARRRPPGKPPRTPPPAEEPLDANDAEYFTHLVYKKVGQSRHTQDSPILPDVFIHYGTQAGDPRLDLLLTPDWSKPPAQLAIEVKRCLGINGDEADPLPSVGEKGDFLVAHNHSVVAIRLTFEELVCYVLPLSWWWQNSLIAIQGLDPAGAFRETRLMAILRNELREGLAFDLKGGNRQERETGHWMIRDDLIWAAQLFWEVRYSTRAHRRIMQQKPRTEKERRDRDAYIDQYIEQVIEYLVDELLPRTAERQRQLYGDDMPRQSWVYSINRNRAIQVSLMHSVSTTKADAVIRTFDVRGEGICWAVIDTGIDARHAAFRKMKDGRPHKQAFANGDNNTRIKATYDFSNIRQHLSKDQERALGSQTGRLVDWEQVARKIEDEEKQRQEILKKQAEQGEAIENDSKKIVFHIPHKEGEYHTPQHGHGTHVAGILAADWRPDPEAVDPLGPPPTKHTAQEPLTGICPEIELYDLRVFKPDGTGDEFAVMSALQFVRSLNQRQDSLEIHGVNLSLAMQHEVANFACGRSPVCEECTRLVANGVVVVAAAGNDGRSLHTTTQNQIQEGYRTVSIADPGNAEAVITVGSTHRREPHTYGVSYFSSRGPTGDGRAKPDLVAPGEKILSTLPGDRKGLQDGTSQAAPHVSGAAALLMCRHTELKGCPARIKQVLMDSATDLGREKHFQGAGLVDVLRAMQSI